MGPRGMWEARAPAAFKGAREAPTDKKDADRKDYQIMSK